jgi:NADH-quinone oxidoreductase subunit H
MIPAVNATAIGIFWFRGTFPRFRYDQLMNIGWKIAIPVGMAAVIINAILGMPWHS